MLKTASVMGTAIKRIGTHDGVFHCDEVLACFMLKRLPEYKSAEIIRTRDETILNTCDVVVDVGKIYDPAVHRYDHHQRDFHHSMKSLVPSRPWDIKLSSAGLIYHHFGKRILQSILGTSYDSELLDKLFDYVYENFVLEVDGIDNGVLMFDGTPRYHIHTGISSRVKNLNKQWNTTEDYDSQKMFHVAMDLVGGEFIDRVNNFTKSWWPARSLVKEAICNRFSVHENGEIVELKQFCPWQKHLLDIEEELDIKGTLKFVIFQNESWRVQAIPVEPNSFKCRLFLLEKWRGLAKEELSKVSEIDGCIFVHKEGFIGGSKTREGVMEMALKTIQSEKQM